LQAHCQSRTSQRYNQSFVKELANPAQVTAFQDGFRIAIAQKNKINLRFVDTKEQLDRIKKIAKQMTNKDIQPTPSP
jgi:CMP-2-keto-3-deoxyoctulosonic acid synthetase